jgi:hypothetical protein
MCHFATCDWKDITPVVRPQKTHHDEISSVMIWFANLHRTANLSERVLLAMHDLLALRW